MAIWDWLTRSASPRLPHRDDYRVFDVPGSRTRTIAGTSGFEDTVSELPLGPVQVTMRLQAKGSDGAGLGAYIQDRQVGWLATQRRGDTRMASGFLWRDPWVLWMEQLDAAGLQPRFQGLLRIAGEPGRRVINVDVPGRDEPSLSAIAKRAITVRKNPE